MPDCGRHFNQFYVVCQKNNSCSPEKAYVAYLEISILNIQALHSEQTVTTQTAEIPISTLPIRLGQFLKLAEMVQDGLEAKIRIQNGEVQVNGHIEIRRGKQLSDGDLVSMGGKNCRVRLSEEA